MIRLAVAAACVLALPLLVGCNPHLSGDSDVVKAEELYAQRRFAEAIPHLQHAVDMPLGVYSRSEVLTMIGNCYNELDRYEESLGYHDQAILEDPNNHSAYVNKGAVCRLMGDYEAAATLYRKALALAPDYAELHGSMGTLAIYQGDYQSAIKHLERSIEIDDTLAVAYSNLAIAYATVGRFDDANAQLKEAVIRGYHQPEAVAERIRQLRKLSESE